MYLSAEARSLVRSLLQPDPTMRLTAGQTLLHPWVEAMAAVCRQGAPRDKTQANAAEEDGVQRLHQNNASEKPEPTEKEPMGPLEGRPGLHTPDRSQSGSPGGGLAPEGPHPACAGKRISLGSYLTQMDPLPQIRSQTEQNSPSHLTPHTPASANQKHTQSGHLVSTRPSANPATASSSQPPHQQNSSCSLYTRNSSAVHKTD